MSSRVVFLSIVVGGSFLIALTSQIAPLF